MTAVQTMGVRYDGYVATVTLLTPAMGPEFFDELPVLFGQLDTNPDVRAIVIEGDNGNFSYGLDLKKMTPVFAPLIGNSSAKQRFDFLSQVDHLQHTVTAVAECRTPIVAAVSGWCIGGGVDLISTVDVRVASTEAMFSIREAQMAIVADLGSLQRLSGIIGEGHLRELALTGEDFDAHRAEQIGLVNHVTETAEAASEKAQQIAARIAANSPLVTRGIKDVLDVKRSRDIAEGLRYVGLWNSAFLGTEDLGEALTAFAEKRKPEFRGR